MKQFIIFISVFPLYLFANEIIKLNYTEFFKPFIISLLLIISFFIIFILYLRTKNLKNKLNLLENTVETIFNHSQDGIAIINFDTKFLNFNESFLKITGYSKEELLTKTYKELIANEDMKKNEQAIEEAIKKGYSKNFEKNCVVKNGKKISVNITISLLPDKKRLLLTLKDIRSLKIIEQQTKLVSMGEMIGNIAHQWRQPLSAITSCASSIRLKYELSILDKDDIPIGMDDIIKQAKYLSYTIDNFRNFIKGENSNSNISIKNLINDTLSLTSSSLSNNYINIILDLKKDINIIGNKNELIEAFINIINNSKDVLLNKKEEDRFLFIKTKKLEIEIYDSGDGIPEDIIDKIFEPYFTTKHQSQGTGLGLAMVDKIIRDKHNALITVTNKEFEYKNKKYKGACIKIIFKTK